MKVKKWKNLKLIKSFGLEPEAEVGVIKLTNLWRNLLRNKFKKSKKLKKWIE